LHITFCTVFFQRDEEYRGVECLCVQNNPEFILISVSELIGKESPNSYNVLTGEMGRHLNTRGGYQVKNSCQ
jgi:hypothetical protein